MCVHINVLSHFFLVSSNADVHLRTKTQELLSIPFRFRQAAISLMWALPRPCGSKTKMPCSHGHRNLQQIVMTCFHIKRSIRCNCTAWSHSCAYIYIYIFKIYLMHHGPRTNMSKTRKYLYIHIYKCRNSVAEKKKRFFLHSTKVTLP